MEGDVIKETVKGNTVSGDYLNSYSCDRSLIVVIFWKCLWHRVCTYLRKCGICCSLKPSVHNVTCQLHLSNPQKHFSSISKLRIDIFLIRKLET